MKHISLVLLSISLLLFPFTIDAQEDQDSIVVDFALMLSDSIEAGNFEFVNTVFDAEFFFEKFAYRDSSNAEVIAFNSGFNSVGHQIMKNILDALAKAESSYNLVNYYEETPGAYFLRFRMFGEDGFNYHDYEVIFDDSGKPMLGDVFVYLSGEYMSETMRPIYYAAISKFVEDDAFSEYSDSFDQLRKLTTLKKLLGEGKIEEAKTLYESIPEDFREERLFLIFGLRIYSTEGDEDKYFDVVETYTTKYPSNASIYLLSIDKYYKAGDFETSHAMVDSLIAITDDDLLHFLKGNLYYEMEDYINAEIKYEYIAENYPYMSDNWSQLFDLDVYLGKHDLAIRCLDRMIEDCGYIKQSLVDVINEDYEAFSKTTVFMDWAKE